MNNLEKLNMSKQIDIAAELIKELETSRDNLMDTLKTVTEADFLMALEGKSVIGEQERDSIVTLLVLLAHEEEKKVSGTNKEIPNITEPPQAIHYLLGVRWDTNRIIRSNTSPDNFTIIVEKIIDREAAVAKKIASRPPLPRNIEIPIIDGN